MRQVLIKVFYCLNSAFFSYYVASSSQSVQSKNSNSLRKDTRPIRRKKTQQLKTNKRTTKTNKRTRNKYREEFLICLFSYLTVQCINYVSLSVSRVWEQGHWCRLVVTFCYLSVIVRGGKECMWKWEWKIESEWERREE